MPPENISSPEASAQEAPRSHSLLLTAALLLVVAALALGGFAWWLGLLPIGASRGGSQEYTSETTPFDVLVQKNNAFAEAEALFQSGRYQDAKQKYQEALAGASDTLQEGQIKIKIAHATLYGGDPESAIQMYKELAASNVYIDFVRAYAVQTLGYMLVSPEYVSYLPTVFSGEPYASFFVEDDKALSYRNLFDYASSFHPLALPELFSANWYADELVRMQDSGAEDSAARALYLETINEKLANAEADLQRVSKDENERVIVPEVYKRRATLLGKLAVLGEVSTQEAEQAFVEAMNLHALRGAGVDGYMRFFYAEYLNALGDGRVEDLRTVLAPFYTSSAYAQSSAIGFFRDEKSNQFLQKETLQEFANKDPKFKDLLISLGWTQTDLSQ